MMFVVDGWVDHIAEVFGRSFKPPFMVIVGNRGVVPILHAVKYLVGDGLFKNIYAIFMGSREKGNGTGFI